MKIDVLYFQGCPNHAPTVQRVKEVLDQLGIAAEVNEVEVTQHDDPAALKFIGSPTVLVAGQDIDPGQREGANYGFCCRTYDGAGMPSVQMLAQAVREAAGGNGHGDDGDSRATVRSHDQSSQAKPGSPPLSSWSTPVAVGSAVLSSACCWLPLLLLSFGVTAGGVAGFFESVRPFFLAAAVLFLGTGFYFAYFRGFRKPVCQPGDACAVPNRKLQRFNRAMLWVAGVFVIAFALFPYYSPALVRAFAGPPANVTATGNGADPAEPASTRVFHIQGMTCPTCAATLEVHLAKLPGVAEARVSFDNAAATIRSAPDTPSPDAVRTAVEQVGFKLAEP